MEPFNYNYVIKTAEKVKAIDIRFHVQLIS